MPQGVGSGCCGGGSWARRRSLTSGLRSEGRASSASKASQSGARGLGHVPPYFRTPRQGARRLARAHRPRAWLRTDSVVNQAYLFRLTSPQMRATPRRVVRAAPPGTIASCPRGRPWASLVGPPGCPGKVVTFRLVTAQRSVSSWCTKPVDKLDPERCEHLLVFAPAARLGSTISRPKRSDTATAKTLTGARPVPGELRAHASGPDVVGILWLGCTQRGGCGGG